MAEKSTKRLMLERSVAEDPTDAFLRYGLAVQCLRDGDTDEGRRQLRALLAEGAGGQEVAAYQQLGQSHLEAGEAGPAREALAAGIARARAVGNVHAATEMEGLLLQLDDA
ncbi:MAG TPA: hypothetical protein VG406_22425 [Isosphaeraceae bacterium]|jgi:thioredoxin-like negative regulator of GroEL|nr:hypothetical protein [Isosphaeraceae bacterium]